MWQVNDQKTLKYSHDKNCSANKANKPEEVQEPEQVKEEVEEPVQEAPSPEPPKLKRAASIKQQKK